MPTMFEAFLRERQIKGWTRRKKEALINCDGLVKSPDLSP
jgi:predicted GIY-YIG superfamily endonuclease